MDTITPQENFQAEFSADLVITNEAKFYLNTAARWANFLGILGFIFTGFTVLSALYWLVLGGTVATVASQQANPMMPPMYGTFIGMMSSVGGFVFLIYAVVLFFISFYLVRFAGGAKKAVLYNSVADVTKGLQNLKSFFKLWGILAIIAIALSVIGFIAMIVFAATVASGLNRPL